MTTKLNALLTNGGYYTDIDLVGSLQMLPHHINLSKNTTLRDFCDVADILRVNIRFSTMGGVFQAFLKLVDKLEVYNQFKTTSQDLNVTLMDMTASLNMTMTQLLSAKDNITTILDGFKSANKSSP